MRYRVKIQVITPDYKYFNLLKSATGERIFVSRESAQDAIEAEIANWPNWDAGRKSIFRTRCTIEEIQS